MTDKYWFLILSIVAIVESTVITQNNKKVAATPDDDGPHLLLIKEKGGLVQIASSTYQVTGEFEGGEDALAVDYHYPSNLLIWSTRRGRIYSTDLKESRKLAYVRNASLVYAEERWLPASLAVDYLNDRLYVLDTRTNTIRVLDLSRCSVKGAGDGLKQTIIGVAERDFKASHVHVDPSEGFVFLVDHGRVGKDKINHILRMNLDGSEPMIIDPSFLGKEIVIGNIALDRENKLILVSSVIQRKIFVIDYNGNIVRDTILQKESPAAAMSVTATRNELFWVNAFDFYNNGSGKAYADGSAYRCSYDPELGCRANSTRRIAEKGVIQTLHAIEPTNQIIPNVNDDPRRRCRKGGRLGCAHFCFELPRNDTRESTCACEIGWRLDVENRADCQRVREFFIYEDAGVVRGGCLDRRCQPFAPFRPELRYKSGERTGFDYDPTTRKIYYGGEYGIYEAEIDNVNSSRLLLHQKGVFFGPMALNWVSKNLYYTEIEQRGNVSFYTMKVTSVRSGEPELAQTSSSLLWEFGGVHTIAVHPDRGYLFVSIFNHAQKHHQLLRLTVDAKNPTTMEKWANVTFASIDYREDRLFTLNVTTLDVVSSDLDGKNAKKICNVKSLGSDITGLSVHDDFVYVQNRTSVRKFDKNSGDDLGELNLFPYDTRMTVGMRFHDYNEVLKIETANIANPCALDNGGCDNFCFAVPRNGSDEALEKVCRCFDGIKCKNTKI